MNYATMTEFQDCKRLINSSVRVIESIAEETMQHALQMQQMLIQFRLLAQVLNNWLKCPHPADASDVEAVSTLLRHMYKAGILAIQQSKRMSIAAAQIHNRSIVEDFALPSPTTPLVAQVQPEPASRAHVRLDLPPLHDILAPEELINFQQQQGTEFR